MWESSEGGSYRIPPKSGQIIDDIKEFSGKEKDSHNLYAWFETRQVLRKCEYHGFWAQNPLSNRPSICTGPLLDSNPNMAQNSPLPQNHVGATQMGKPCVPSPLAGRPVAYKIFIHGSLSSSRLKTIILNERELVFYKES